MTSIDPKEVQHFESLSHTWWDETGPFQALHELNSTRISFIRDHITNHFSLSRDQSQPLKGLRLLDVGCGGGLLSEPMCRLGAQVIGVDAAPQNIQIAQTHAQQHDLNIDYRDIAVEELNETFDVVLCMEVIEHVPSVEDLITSCCKLVKPNGLIFLSTLNRTPKSFLFGIVAAEYILRWVPKGTHHWEKFVRPSELKRYLKQNNFSISDKKGVRYNLLHKAWEICSDDSVNYMICAANTD